MEIPQTKFFTQKYAIDLMEKNNTCKCHKEKTRLSIKMSPKF